MNYTELHKTTPTTKNCKNYIKTTLQFYYMFINQLINAL